MVLKFKEFFHFCLVLLFFTPSNAEKFISELGNPYIAIGSDTSGKTAINWGVYGIPETFLLDKENKILLRIAGPITKAIYESQLKDYLE